MSTFNQFTLIGSYLNQTLSLWYIWKRSKQFGNGAILSKIFETINVLKWSFFNNINFLYTNHLQQNQFWARTLILHWHYTINLVNLYSRGPLVRKFLGSSDLFHSICTSGCWIRIWGLRKIRRKKFKTKTFLVKTQFNWTKSI